MLTHAHEDHCGLAKQVRDRGEECRDTNSRMGNRTSFRPARAGRTSSLYAAFGRAGHVFEEMRGLYEEISLLTDSLDESDYKPLVDDEMELEFDSGSLRVLHTPGHTPGSCSFVREADRTLICGDCVLKRITPNPILSPDPIDPTKRFPSLAEYLVSLATPSQLFTDARLWRPRRTCHRFRRDISPLRPRDRRPAA